MATSIASVTTDTTNYTRIHLILMKGGTLLTKTLFLKRVKDLSPAGHELTVDEFLGKHRVQILSTSTGRNNEEKLYPLTGTTNLDEWDLPLYCFILKTVCDLLWINKMDMKFLKTMRNELSHLHDPSLTDEDFKSRLSMIEPIFTRSLQVINDPLFEGEITNLVQRYKTGALAVDEIVKIHHDSSRKHIELLSNQLKIMKNQVDILQNQNIHNTQLTTALSMLKKIDDKLPSGSDVDIPDVCVIIEVKNCTRDKEQELLDFLVKQFNETISKPECNLTKDFPNLAMHTISEAICTTLKEFLAKGRHVLKVEKKCISLTIKCNSLSSFVSLVSDYIDGSLLHQLKSLKDAVRRWDGCAGADLDPTISADGISSAILKIATNLDEKLLEEDQSAVLLLPEVCSSTMSVDSPSSLETFPLCSTGSILRLTIKPDTIECRKEIEESFIGSVTEGLEQFQNELRKDPDFQNLVIEAKILASDNGRTVFTVRERTPDKTAFLSPNKIVKSYKSKTWNMRKEMKKLFTSLKKKKGKEEQCSKDVRSTSIPSSSMEASGTEESLNDDRRTLPVPRQDRFMKDKAFQGLQENKENKDSKHLLVAGFDLGTAYSGYALSFRDEPTKIQINQSWNAGSLLSNKTSTCILLKPNREFDSFGFEAENNYTELVEEQKHDGWYFFRRFKMFLHNNQGLTRDAEVEDISGKPMPALTVFAMAIGYMRDHLLKHLQKQLPDIKESEIKYVLTVPAIWNDKAKQFMREAGIKAGIDTERLMLALEPEAASIWCQLVPTEEGRCLSAPGTRYMVADLGGGTADISVHEKISDGSLKQLHRASGGPWGGCSVDHNYLEWLANVFGKLTMERFKTEEVSDYFDLLREWETKKQTIKYDKYETSKRVTLRLHSSLRGLYERCENGTVEDAILKKGLADLVKCRNDKLFFDPSIIKEWFRDPIDQIAHHINEILAEPKMSGVDTILLVGGFGQCELVQNKLQTLVQNKRWVIPEDAGLVVLKGAVRFGHLPGIVTERVAPYTYGTNTCCPFDPKVHPLSKLYISNGMELASNVFGVFVRYGEEIATGHEEKRIFTPVMWNETSVNIYISSKSNPQFVDDPGCQKIGSLSVSHPGEEPLENKEFEVTFYFGNTELHVTVRMLKNDQEIKAVIDCL